MTVAFLRDSHYLRRFLLLPRLTTASGSIQLCNVKHIDAPFFHWFTMTRACLRGPLKEQWYKGASAAKQEEWTRIAKVSATL